MRAVASALFASRSRASCLIPLGGLGGGVLQGGTGKPGTALSRPYSVL